MANFCTLNPLTINNCTLSNGNLTVTAGSGGNVRVFGTHYMTSGKWYCEAVGTLNAYHHYGIHAYGDGGYLLTDDANNGRIVIRSNDGYVYIDGALDATTTSFTTGDVIGIAVDMDNGKLYYYKNGTNISGAGHNITGYTTRAYTFHGLYNDNAGLTNFNFGQFPWRYDPPSGFVALSTENLPEPTISNLAAEKPEDHFASATYTGNGGTLSVSVGFAPDFIWIKNRSNAFNHRLYDTIRGASKALQSNQTNAEATYGAQSFTSDGFQFTSDAQQSHNTNGDNYVAWCWKAGGTAVNNTSGTIASQVSANTDAGFSIVSYTGNATRGATVGHGLGAVPSFVIIKNRENGAENWLAWHKSLSGTFPSLRLNTTGATTDSGDGVVIRGSEFTSSVISVGENGTCNGNNQGMIAYCWTEIEGYSKFGSFSGNNSTDGPFIHLGFRPALFVVKCTNTYGSWYAYDTTRANYNPMGASAAPIGWDLNGAEASPDSSWYVDAVSSGIKIRNNSNFDNGSNSFVYMAFADSPTKYSSAR